MQLLSKNSLNWAQSDVHSLSCSDLLPLVLQACDVIIRLCGLQENNKTQGKSRFTSPKGVGRKSKSRTSKSQQELNELNKSDASAGTKAASHPEQPTPAHIFHMQQQSLGEWVC